MITRLIFFTVFLLMSNDLRLSAQTIIPMDRFNKFLLESGIDSVFIYTKDIAVTASGEPLQHIQYLDDQINGENIPPTLKLRNPMGAIFYKPGNDIIEVPVIVSRQNIKMSWDKVLRNYLLNMTESKGISDKGGIHIKVWQKEDVEENYLIFLKSGQIIGNRTVAANTKNNGLFTVDNFFKIQHEIAGIWLYPPDRGNNQVTTVILQFMQQGPLLVEYWDGVGWKFFEECYLSGNIKGLMDEAEIAYALYPPETKSNYAGMISGGFTKIDGKLNLFQCFQASGVDYQLLEGEKLMFPVPGTVQLHTGPSPEIKDESVFHSATSVIKKSTPPLLFLHYHGVDDLMHTFGPNGDRPVNHTKQLWKWHLELRRLWPGNLLIVSDHGAHAVIRDDDLNEKFRDKGTKGSHGQFIFEDMAVPIIHDIGRGKTGTEFKLTIDQTRQIWDMVGTAATNEATAPKVKPGILEIHTNSQVKRINVEDDKHLFHEEFQFEYLKKGMAFSGIIKGLRLRQVLDELNIKNITQIIARSYDDHQVAFTWDDLLTSELVIALDRSVTDLKDSFTLYPLNDRFPNRVLKQLMRIEVY